MKINWKKEKGFTTIDITIAMLVIIVFVSITTSLMYSTYLSTTEAKRTAVALNYGVEIFERVGAMPYIDVNNDNWDRIIGTVDDSYNVAVSITEPYRDQIKQINLTITYKVSAKETQRLDLSRIKVNNS